MWIGSIRVLVQTKDARYVATESLVQAALLLKGKTLRILRDLPSANDRVSGRIRTYCDWRDPAAQNDLSTPTMKRSATDPHYSRGGQ